MKFIFINLDFRHAGGGGGHPSLLFPSEGVLLSSQHPKSVSLHGTTGQPLFLGPEDGETPSGQQPCLVSLQVSGVGQPTNKILIKI